MAPLPSGLSVRMPAPFVQDAVDGTRLNEGGQTKKTTTTKKKAGGGEGEWEREGLYVGEQGVLTLYLCVAEEKQAAPTEGADPLTNQLKLPAKSKQTKRE